jgi:hypothetical protein
MKYKISIFLVMSSIFSTLVLSADNIQFQNVRVGGMGCQSDMTQIVFSPDNSELSILFQNYESRVPVPRTGSLKDNPYVSQIPCNLFFEVNVPRGQKLQSLELTYNMRGNATFDVGVQGYFKSYLMNAMGLGIENRMGRGPQLLIEKVWTNTSINQSDDFVLSSTKRIDFLSDCNNGNIGSKIMVNLQHHIYTQITVPYQNTNVEGAIVVDSSDMNGGIKLKASSVACNVVNNGGRPTPPPFPRRPFPPRWR